MEQSLHALLDRHRLYIRLDGLWYVPDESRSCHYIGRDKCYETVDERAIALCT